MAGPAIDRRTLLAGAAALPVAGGAHAALLPNSAADEDRFWREVAAQYDVTREVIQLENGNWGMMARPVLAAYREHGARVNRDTSYYTRRGMAADWNAAREALAEAMGLPSDEVALTRNATEALKALILGYNRLRPGDAVLYADLDYDSMQACMENLARARGATVVRIALPEPASGPSLIDAYAAAFEAHPKLRLILLTHLSHRTGLVLPVREIAAIARARGIDTIVDAAHSWCQLELNLAELDCDFIGVNCHKWLGAPLGVGALHIRKAALSAIDHDAAETAAGRDVIDTRVHTGTVDYAATLTLPAAIAFQRGIGAVRRAARLRALRDRWVSQVRGTPGIEILTPDDLALHGGITSFRLAGVTSVAANAALARGLLQKRGIFTIHRSGVARGACVRVTPALFNTMADMDALAAALRQVEDWREA